MLWTYQKILDGRWLCAAQIATVFTLLFRCELALFYACIFIHPVLMRRIPLFGWNGAIVRCVLTAFLTLGVFMLLIRLLEELLQTPCVKWV